MSRSRWTHALSATFLGVAMALPAHAKEAAIDASAPLPVDDRYEVDETLPNGLRLLVRRNALPAQRVAIYLHVGTGSLNERDDERGLAHYLEHLAFNGSRHFPPGTLIPSFEDMGIGFGRDQNAFTGFDQTTYVMDVPTNEPAALSKVLLFLSDVAFRLDLSEKEVDAERGVILEEARSRESPQTRLMERMLPIIGPGSRMAKRLPIGTTEVIEAIDAELMRGYYERWYRPELSTLMVVGDVDPQLVAALARLGFADWRTKADGPEPLGSGVEPNEGLKIAVLTDPEIHETDISLLRTGKVPPRRTVGDMRQSLVERMGRRVLSQRLRRRVQEGQSAYRSARAMAVPFAGDVRLAMVTLTASPADWSTALEQVLTEVRRVRVHGVLESELADARKVLLAGYEQQVEAAATQRSSTIVAQLNREIAMGTSPMSESDRLALAERLLPTIGADEVVAALKAELDLSQGHLMLTLPETEGTAAPDQAAVRAVLAKVAASEVAPPEAQERVERLVAQAPAPVSPTEVIEHAEVGVTELRFANGIVAYVRPMDTTSDVTVLMSMFGGISEEPPSQRSVTALTVNALEGDRMATKSHPSARISEYLSPRKVGVGVGRQEGSVTVAVSGSPSDLEAGLEVAHLVVTEPLITPSAFGAGKAELLRDIEQASTDVQQRAMSGLTRRMAGIDDPRLRMPTAAEVAAIDVPAAQAWAERMLQKAPCDVVMVGKIELARAVELLSRWVGTLPARDPQGRQAFEQARTLPFGLMPGGEQTTVETETPMAMVAQGWGGAIDRDDDESMARLMQLSMILTPRLLRTVREEHGLTYSIQALPNTTSFRGLEHLLLVFTSDPSKIGEATEIAKGVADELAAKGPTAQELGAIGMQLQAGVARQRQAPGFWVSALSGGSLKRDPIARLTKGLAALVDVDGEAIAALAKRIIRDPAYAHVIVRPTKPGGDSDAKPDGPKDE